MAKTNWHSVREYEVLRAMIMTGTTTAAAEKLGVAQSTVSRALSELEHRYETTLFTCEGSRIVPTAEALRINASLDPLFAALQDIEGQSAKDREIELRIAAPPTIAHRFLQPHIASFLEINGATRVSLEVCASDALINGIAEERFDIGITDLESRHGSIKFTPFRRSKLVCVLKADDPLAELEHVGPSELADRSLIALTRRHSVRNLTERAFKTAGIDPQIKIETATAESALEFVRQGTGLALVNAFPISSGLPGDLTLRPFLPTIDFKTSFWTATGAALDAPARAFIRHVKLATPADPWSEAL